MAELNYMREADILRLLDNPNTLPTIEWTDIATVHDDRRALLVTSPSAETQFGNLSHNFNFSDHRMITGGDAEYIDHLIKDKPDTSVMYAVGGGRVIDIARLLASRWEMEVTAIPTIISTDALFVKSTGVRENGCVHYVRSKRADRVLLDWNLLRLSPQTLNAGGCCDVLSIYTAPWDWNLTETRQAWKKPNEHYTPLVAEQAAGILNYLLSHADEIRAMSYAGLESIVRSLAMEVELCNVHGNSRCEEGGEHFFAYALEPHLPHTTHGELVGLGILVTAYMQGQPWQNMREFMDTIGMSYRPKGISEQRITQTLKIMQAYVTQHNLRYSIWNEYIYNESASQEFLRTINL